MAERRRIRRPVERYGFSDILPTHSSAVDLDASDDGDGIEDSSEDSSSDENESLTFDDMNDRELENLHDDDAWIFVTKTTDNLPSELPLLDNTNTLDILSKDFLSQMEVVDFLNHFLPDSLLSKLCDWTNLRARIEVARQNILLLETESDVKEIRWKNVEKEEMKLFLGLTFLMGLIRKPELRDYWATEPLFVTPFFLSVGLSRNRYMEILRFIRFSDSSQSDPTNKYNRLAGLLEEVHKICSSFVPDKNLSIDETLLLFKGRLQIKCFIRIKRARFGVKLFVLTDSDGFMLHCIPYTGEKTDLRVDDPDAQNLLKSEKTIVALMERSGLLDKGYVVHADNWYTSHALALYLFKRRTGLRGTLNPRRGAPKILQDKSLLKDESAFVRKGHVLICKYHDKKIFYSISTVDTADTVEKNRILRGGHQTIAHKPAMVDSYNKHMAGVDLSDQMLAPYSPVRKSHVWFKKCGFSILHRLLLNAYLLHRKMTRSGLAFKAFTRQAILYLTGTESVPSRGGRKPAAITTEQPIQHSLRKIPATEKKDRPTKRCRVCFSAGHRKDSRYECRDCADHPGLCMACFTSYHLRPE